MLPGAGGSSLRCPKRALQVIVRRCTTVKKRPGRPPLVPGGVPPNGRDLSRQLRSAIKEGVENFKANKGYAPQLAILTVGPRPAEEEKRRQLFAEGPDTSWFDKASAARAVSMECTQVHLPVDAPLERVVSQLRALSRRRDVHGVMVELPLPPHLHEYRREIWASIDPRKDVDGMGPESCARLFDLAAGVCPSSAAPLSPQSHLMESTPLHRNVSTTALGVMEYLDAYGLVVQEGTHCLVIGRSKLVGLPIASLLLARRASVSVAHSHTSPEHLKALCKAADVIVVAAGVPNLVRPQWVKKGTLVVNVGTTFDEEKGELLTDTQDAVRALEDVVVTPTPRRDATGLGPSGVGPLTLPFLLHSTLVNALALAYDEEEKTAVHSMRGCRKDTASLGDKELQQVLKKGKYRERGWEVRADKDAGTASMAKTFELCDFDEALSFCVDIKHAAEDLNHHPNLHVTKKRCVTVELTSEVVGGKLTHFDLEMADKIDALTTNTTPTKPAAARGGGKKKQG